VARRLLADYWTFFLIPIVLTALFWSLGAASNGSVLLRILYANVVITSCVGGAIYLFFALFGERLARRLRHGWQRFFLTAAIMALALVLGGETALRLLNYLPGLDEIHVSRRGFYAIGTIAVSIAWLVEATLGRLRDRTRQLELREEQSRRQALRAQYEALQARTHPHFLYNSLNTVAGLIEEDPRRAERALEILSDLLRYSLDGARRECVPLAEEIAAVRGYLDMERLRFGDRLSAHVDLEPGTEVLAVPPLVLQPLVENAVLHGIAPRPAGGRVQVSAARCAGALELVVEDDGFGPGASPHQGTRTAFRDLHERLELLYGDQGRLTIGPAAHGGCRVQVRIPAVAYGAAAGRTA
jgi:hypothetical protein